MRTYKPSHKDKKGKRQYSKKWYIKIRDHNQKMRLFPGFTDRKQTQLLGQQIERLMNCRIAGEQPDSQLTRFIERTDSKLRKRLADLGLLSRKAAIAGEPLAQHIEDFFQSLLAKENTLKRAKGVTSKVRRIVEGCKFETWSDIQPDKVQKFLADLRNDGKGISAQTYNWYRQAIKQFCNWMVRDSRADKSPVEHLSGLNVQMDRRHDRRALTVDEIHRLLDATEKAKTRFGMTGHQRALLYQLAIETGLRASELRSLTVGSFDFKGLAVTVKASYSKRRRQDTLPLRPDTAAVLKEFFANKMPNTQAFLVPDKPVEMLKADLEEAAIPYVDDTERYADFHSLRHTTGTLLAMSGAHPKVIQSIMRHSDINLTMSRYTHIFKSQESEAIAKLPDLSQSSRQRKPETGTNG